MRRWGSECCRGRSQLVSDVATLVSGGTPSRNDPKFWGGTVPWITCKDMKADRLGDSSERSTEAGLEAGSRLVPAGSVLIVIRGMILARDVPVALATRPVAFNQDLKALLPERVTSTASFFSMRSSRQVRDLQQMTARAVARHEVTDDEQRRRLADSVSRRSTSSGRSRRCCRRCSGRSSGRSG